MENMDEKYVDSLQNVRVVVNIRPLITSEMEKCTVCTTVVPGEPQIRIDSHVFNYDNVYGGTGSPSHALYDKSIAPLVAGLFQGYNATVLAYGQTGSGKTTTMGANNIGEGNKNGVIPKVVEHIFKNVEVMKDSTEFFIRVSFIEILNEKIFDLLDQKGGGKESFSPRRAFVQIREMVNGEITLVGVTEVEVHTTEEMTSHLSRGSLARSTGSTNMNSQSSRSHADIMITVEQKKKLGEGMSHDDACILCAKLHLVDLAGSGGLKRKGHNDKRFNEGVHINTSLLALNNIISVLGDDKKRGERRHVPYRSSKLTHLLKDSLGGNSRMTMIACVSPADSNVHETLATLKLASNARKIQNKAIISRNPVGGQIPKMQSENESLKTERSGASLSYEELQALMQKIEHELEAKVTVYEERSKMTKELGKLKKEEDFHRGVNLSESILDGSDHWHPADAKNIMDFLMSLTFTSRCLLWNKEFEKDSEIRELKHSFEEKDSEIKKLKHSCEEKDSEIRELKHSSEEKDSEIMKLKQVLDVSSMHKKSEMQQEHQNYDTLLADMDSSTSDSSTSDSSDHDDEIYDWEKSMKRRLTSKRVSRDGVLPTDVCCTCSRSSSCKTRRCQCIVNGGACGLSCSCLQSMCSNKSERDESIKLNNEETGDKSCDLGTPAEGGCAKRRRL